MSEFDNVRFESGFEIPIDQEYAGTPRFLNGVTQAYGPGLFKVVFTTEDQKTRAQTPFDTLFLDEVKTQSDEPDISEDDFAQILLSRIYAHNKEHGRKIRYKMKANYRGRGQNVKQIYETLIVEEGDDPQVAAPRTPIEFIEADDSSPGAMFMEHLGASLAEIRNFQREMRHDVKAARDHTNTIMDKMISVIASQVQHSENQSVAAQAGWDALHTGVAMQKKHHEEVADMRAALQAQEAELSYLRDSTKKEKRNEIAASFLPAGLTAAGKALTDKGSPFGALLTGLASMASGGGAAPSAPPPAAPPPTSPTNGVRTNGVPTNGAPPSARTVDANVIDEVAVDMEEMCTTEEISDSPLVCLARTLRNSLGPSQKVAIHDLLTAPEWDHLNAAMAGDSNAAVAQNMMQFFMSFQQRDADNTLYKQLAARLSLFQRNVIKAVSDYVTGSTEALDSSKMKTSYWKRPPAQPPTEARRPQPTQTPTEAEPSEEIKKVLSETTAALQRSTQLQEEQARKIAELEKKLSEKPSPRQRKSTKKTTKNTKN